VPSRVVRGPVGAGPKGRAASVAAVDGELATTAVPLASGAGKSY